MTTLEELEDELDRLTGSLGERQQGTVYGLPKEKNLKAYTVAATKSIVNFKEDVEAAIRLRKLTRESAANFVLAHIEGAARQELKHRDDSCKKDAARILRVLTDTFGERITLSNVMSDICTRVQKEDESIADFAYTLMSLSDEAHWNLWRPKCHGHYRGTVPGRFERYSSAEGDKAYDGR